MGKIEVRCPVCQSSFVIGSNNAPVAELSDGIHYLVPETIRNENVFDGKVNDRMKAFKDAGIDISKLQSLMQTDVNIKEIFSDPNDEILTEIGKGGFIRNPELFRRFITAQTWYLIRNEQSWTEAVRKRYNISYVFKQTKQELRLQIKLMNKGIENDHRYSFFSLDDMKDIFWNLASYNYSVKNEKFTYLRNAIMASKSRKELLDVISSSNWWFRNSEHYKPRRWLNSFKGAGAYYTLQNLIRTHGLVLPKCADMNESLKVVEEVYNSIMSYDAYQRRWDILMSLLVNAVRKTNFELKY
jgi:hypothetical protein